MARDYKEEYRRYQSSPEQKKRRAGRNKARRQMIREGRASKGDGRDVDHRDGNPNNNSRSNLRMRSRSSNRSIRRTRTARKRHSSD